MNWGETLSRLIQGQLEFLRREKVRQKKISEENKGSEISKLDENSKPLIQGTQQTPNTRSVNKITPRNIIIEQLKPL